MRAFSYFLTQPGCSGGIIVTVCLSLWCFVFNQHFRKNRTTPTDVIISIVTKGLSLSPFFVECRLVCDFWTPHTKSLSLCYLIENSLTLIPNNSPLDRSQSPSNLIFVFSIILLLFLSFIILLLLGAPRIVCHHGEGSLFCRLRRLCRCRFWNFQIITCCKSTRACRHRCLFGLSFSYVFSNCPSFILICFFSICE